MNKYESTLLIRIFAKNVRYFRQRNRLSQEELAEKCNLHRTYIGMIERCEKNITLKNIEKIANALQIDVKDLFNDTE